MYSKKRKRIVSIVAVCLVGALLLSLIVGGLSLMVSAEPSSSEIQEQIEGVEGEVSENREQQEALQAQVDTLTEQIEQTVAQKAEIDQNIAATRIQIQETDDQIQILNGEIAEKQAQLDAALADSADLQTRYRARIRSMEETGSVSYWSVLFNADSFSDLLSQIDMIQEVARADQEMLEQLTAQAEIVERERAALEASKVELAEQQAELAALQETFETQRAEQSQLIVQLGEQCSQITAEMLEYANLEEELLEELAGLQSQYEITKAAEEAEAARKAEEERRRQQEIAASSTSSSGSSSGSVPVANASGFMCPVSGYYITDAFGYRWHPIYNEYRFHYGVDMATSYGTPVYASKSGTVYMATYNDVNGNYVKIDHGDGTETFYLHFDHYTVSVGQYVSQGEIIGYVGSSGASTGPHLHFELHVNGTAVNPMDYVS